MSLGDGLARAARAEQQARPADGDAEAQVVEDDVLVEGKGDILKLYGRGHSVTLAAAFDFVEQPA